MSELQFYWLLLCIIMAWILLFTKWSCRGEYKIKFLVSFAFSFCITFVVFLIVTVFKWLG